MDREKHRETVRRYQGSDRGLRTRRRYNQRRRNRRDKPWYEMPQFLIRPELRALRRLYWRTLRRCRHSGVEFGKAKYTGQLIRLMEEVRPEVEWTRPRLGWIASETIRIEKLLDSRPLGV